MPRTRTIRGFTLVEMMIVLVIIGVIAAFTIPGMLESRTSANESGAEKALATLVDAEAIFYKTDYETDGKDFSFNLANLHDQLDGNGQAIHLIDPALAAGLKEGYRFGVCTTYNAAGDADVHGYAYYAVPEVYQHTGRKSYVVNHEGVMFYKDTGSNAVVAAWPDPINDASWIQVGR